MTIDFRGRGDPAATVASLRALADDLERLTMFSPGDELTDAPLLEHWTYDTRPVPVLTGLVIGHPRLGTKNVITTEIFAIDEQRWARSMSRFYRLGRKRTEDLEYS